MPSLGRSLLLGALALASGSMPPCSADTIYVSADKDSLVFSNTPEAGARPFFEEATRGFRGRLRVIDPPPAYGRYLEEAARANVLPVSLLKAVTLVESGFNPRAQSPKGARGLMQLMPATARQHGVADVFDPYQNIHGGAKHLRLMLDEFEGDETLALAAYNAGAGAVRRHGGVPNFRETREYVRRVREARARFEAGGAGSGATETAAVEQEPQPVGEPVQLLRAPDGRVVVAN